MTVGVRNLSSELNFVTGHQGLLRSLTDWKLCDHWKWEHSYLHTPLCLMHGCIFIQIGETHPFENHQLIFVGLFFIQICLLIRLVQQRSDCCVGKAWQGQGVQGAFWITAQSSDGWKCLWNLLRGFCKPRTVCISLHTFFPEVSLQHGI